jgi:hypothetical protein
MLYEDSQLPWWLGVSRGLELPKQKKNIFTMCAISSGAQYNPFKKYFSHLSYFLFYNPTHKTETGTANRWGTANSKRTGSVTVTGQSETLSMSQVIFITLFSTGAQRC